MKRLLLGTFASCCMWLQAQDPDGIKSQVRHTIDEIRDFVAIPNDALDEADINRNISWLTKKFSERGFNTSSLPTGNRPLFFAALPMEDEKPTILFYMHFDGQSVDASHWDQQNPYQVVLKRPVDSGWETLPFSDLESGIPYDWRLFGRSVSDDKGPIVMFLNAIDLMRKQGKQIPFNVKVILDGEEERGSKPLPEAVKQYRELLEADFLVINDGPVHPSGDPTVVYGCRGITTMTLTTYGPVVPQHSGHFGNYAPNPGFQLAQLLAGMKDEEGRVIIPGYYEGIALDEDVRNVLRAVPDDTQSLHQRLGISTPERVGDFYQEALQYPSLNLRGLSSGWTGPQARTIVPATATAELDLRLVPETQGKRLQQLVMDYLEDKGYQVIEKDPSAEMRQKASRYIKVENGPVTDAFRTPLDNPYGQFLSRVLQEQIGKEPVRIRIMGGTVPIAPFINELKIPAFIIPLVNPDNNQHSPNENLKIGQIDYGLRVFMGILGAEPPTP